MAFSLLLNKTFLGLFIIVLLEFSDVLCWKKSNAYKPVDCPWMLLELDKKNPRILNYCVSGIDIVCSIDNENFVNKCEFCIKKKSRKLDADFFLDFHMMSSIFNLSLWHAPQEIYSSFGQKVPNDCNLIY
ncbi:uncharacterized protein LOC127550240 isoform X2 [Antechinus flavipes]|uniref:uncharacterized protein LOC127550240 isoform X2 n=1 Tax=Antechinus flavipes TaxID=38775 RepID=UPI0022354E6C|nr:uncharacterized protein LOC127550240 isoform X2 [Antechinus flavipes]